MSDLIKNCIAFFNVKNNCISIKNSLLTDIEKKVETPFFLYSKEIINERLKLLSDNFPRQINFNYSIKANPFSEILFFLKDKIYGFDVASEAEMLLAIQTNINRERITLTGPGKTKKLLENAIRSQIIINVESISELNKILSISESINIIPNIILRINPSFVFKGSGMRMTGKTQFGLDETNLLHAINIIKNNLLKLKFIGFHIFNGSQNLDKNNIVSIYENSIYLLSDLIDIIYFDQCYIGSSLGIPYFKGDKELDISFIGSKLNDLIKKLSQKNKNIKIHMELGRYIVGPSGIYVTKIITKKDSYGQTFLVTDGGLNHNLAACGLLGQLIRKNYPVIIGNKIESELKQNVTITGPLCTPLDILATNVTLPIAEEDDFIVVFQSGAYGFTASPNAFLNHKTAREILI